MAKNSLKTILHTAPENMNRADRRNATRLLKDEIKRIQNIRSADQMSGAGYPVDQQIRSLVDSCNDERMEGNETPFTNIWDVFQGFTKPEPGDFVNILRLRPERDHAFSAADFFAFATEDELREQALPRLRALVEGQIYNFSVVGDLRDFAFEEEGRDPVALSGIAMVRHKNHLHWLTAGGPVVNLADVYAGKARGARQGQPTLTGNEPELLR